MTIIKLDSKQEIERAISLLTAIDCEAGMMIEIKEAIDYRTLKQNSTMHKYFSMLANALNDAGLDMRKVLKPEIEIQWTEYGVKEYLWRGIQLAMTGIKSTTKINTKQVNDIYLVLDKHLSEKLNISVPFPDRFNESDK